MHGRTTVRTTLALQKHYTEHGCQPKPKKINAERIERSKAAAGVAEETNTWSGWKKLGYEVIHGSKALFGCALIWGSKGDGAIYKASFFGRSQVQEITA